MQSFLVHNKSIKSRVLLLIKSIEKLKTLALSKISFKFMLDLQHSTYFGITFPKILPFVKFTMLTKSSEREGQGVTNSKGSKPVTLQK